MVLRVIVRWNRGDPGFLGRRLGYFGPDAPGGVRLQCFCQGMTGVHGSFCSVVRVACIHRS